jgi:tetratricopeptide (TPR) repeat protein
MGQMALKDSLRAVEAELAAGRADQALALSQDVQARYPRALAVQRVLGEVYLTLRKPREALGALDRALAGNPEDARACCARAIVQQIQGDPLAALAWYRRACDITPDDQVLRAAYREIAAGLGQPAYRPTRTGLARLYMRNQLYPHAIREWEMLLMEQPDLLEAQVGLAETLWRARQTEVAAERCRRILGNIPSCVKALLLLAAVEQDAGNADEARRLARRALELDPDARIGLTLFADRIAAGDQALHALVLGEDLAPVPRAARSPSANRTDEGRPRSQALADQPTAHIAAQSQPLPSPQSLSGDGRLMPPAAQGRTSVLPPDFHTIFAETEYMLWGQDQYDRTGFTAANLPAASTSPAATADGTGPLAQGPTRGDSFARSSVFVPPALRQQSGGLDETEARAAINWIQWLQAQGARPHQAAPGARGTGGLGALPPFAPDRSPASGRLADGPTGGGQGRPGSGALPTGPLPTGPLPTGPLPTGPLPPPTPDALRKMFAELGADTAAPRIVDSELVATSGASGPAHDAATPHQASAADDALSEVPTESLGPVPEEEAEPSESQLRAGATRDEADVTTDLLGMPDGEGDAEAGAPDTTAHDVASSEHDGAAVTLEALEKGFASSGFRSFDLRPGELAALAGSIDESPGARPPSDERDGASWTAGPGANGATELSQSAPAGTFAAESAGEFDQREPDQPASTDYKGRLERARQRRSQGQLDEAINEYRVILRGAPDLLPEIIDELHESMAETPDHPELHRLLGDAHIRKGDYLSALEAYNRAVALTQAQDT